MIDVREYKRQKIIFKQACDDNMRQIVVNNLEAKSALSHDITQEQHD